jgi:hypothetical protein
MSDEKKLGRSEMIKMAESHLHRWEEMEQMELWRARSVALEGGPPTPWLTAALRARWATRQWTAFIVSARDMTTPLSELQSRLDALELGYTPAMDAWVDEALAKLEKLVAKRDGPSERERTIEKCKRLAAPEGTEDIHEVSMPARWIADMADPVAIAEEHIKRAKGAWAADLVQAAEKQAEVAYRQMLASADLEMFGEAAARLDLAMLHGTAVGRVPDAPACPPTAKSMGCVVPDCYYAVLPGSSHCTGGHDQAYFARVAERNADLLMVGHHAFRCANGHLSYSGDDGRSMARHMPIDGTYRCPECGEVPTSVLCPFWCNGGFSPCVIRDCVAVVLDGRATCKAGHQQNDGGKPAIEAGDQFTPPGANVKP